MSMNNTNFRDVFMSFLVSNAHYDGLYEFPKIDPTYVIPNKIIGFSKAISSTDFNQWVHFFQDDYQIERIWRNPKKYLRILKRFNGVILPDFSLYRNMPLAMQLWNIYRSRAIGSWLQENGVKVIPNIRFGDYRTYRYCCDGISRNCVIAIGSHGTMKRKADREVFLKGFDYIVTRLEPSAIIIYGTFPSDLYNDYTEKGVSIIQFESEFATSHKEVI